MTWVNWGRKNIIEERARYKISRTNRYGGDTSLVEISEITTANANDANTVHGQLKILRKRISAVETESNYGESCRPPSSIMGGHNEQSNIRSINQSGDWSTHKVKLQISSKSSIKCMILEPHPSTPSTKTNYSNDDKCFSGTNFIFMSIKEITDNVYPYDT